MAPQAAWPSTRPAGPHPTRPTTAARPPTWSRPSTRRPRRVDVLNLSVGGPPTFDTVERALLGAAEADVVVVAAAGNHGTRSYAAHPGPWVTTVGSTTGVARRGRVVLTGAPSLTGAMASMQGVGPARVVIGGRVARPSPPTHRPASARRAASTRRGSAARSCSATGHHRPGRQVRRGRGGRRGRHGARQHRPGDRRLRLPQRPDRPPRRGVGPDAAALGSPITPTGGSLCVRSGSSTHPPASPGGPRVATRPPGC
ncbi:S8 family serine peptidase [Nocardioides ungokensis]|uniref:S8 family serine peptidase n=1 Tax=Nocardioides ungokensis TaxID=1643322 RepID=UPI003CCD5B9A